MDGDDAHETQRLERGHLLDLLAHVRNPIPRQVKVPEQRGRSVSIVTLQAEVVKDDQFLLDSLLSLPSSL
eukprot:783637-Rhodomonas_salina.1